MSVVVDPQTNLGHSSWSLTSAPAGAASSSLVFWRCDRCGFVVGFWRDGHGSTPTADDTAPADNVGAYTGQVCTG
jgi:hypothetical protein